MTIRVELDGQRVHAARVRWPARGLWSARVSLPEPRSFLPSEPVALSLGALSLVGSVVRGGEYADRSEVLLRAGRGGWARSVRPRSYRSNSVQLSAVLRDLATEVGETWRAGFGPGFLDRSVGYALVRRGGQAARDALAQLVGERWHVDELGETVLGDRPPGVSLARVLDYDAARASVELSAETDALPRPGQTVLVDDAPRALDLLEVSVCDDGVAIWGDLR